MSYEFPSASNALATMATALDVVVEREAEAQ